MLIIAHPMDPRTRSQQLKKILLFIMATLFAFVSSAWGAEVRLAWGTNTETGIAGYKLHYGTASGHYTSIINLGNKAAFTVSNLASGKTYYFAVTAYASDKSESDFSNEVSYTTPTEPTLSSVSIGGPSQLSEDNSAQYVLTARYSDGSTQKPTSGISWSENSSATSINSNGLLTSNSIASDTTVTITASYGGKSDTHSIIVKNIASTLSSITISGPKQVKESSGAQFTCTARYSDSTTSTVSNRVSWSVNSTSASINTTGYLATGMVQAEEELTVTASFEGKNANFNLLISNTNETCSLTIDVLGSGKVLLDPPGGTYEKGTVVTLTAKADPAWAFDGWEGFVSDTASSVTSVLLETDTNASVSFLEDTDLDSVPDQEEWGQDSLKQDFDGNGDGIADYLQGNVASLHTKDYLQYLTLSVPDPARISSCKALDPSLFADSPPDCTLPLGMLSYDIEGITPGDAVPLTFHLPAGLMYSTFYKYGATLDSPSAHWYEFAYDQLSETGAVFEGNNITLYLKDGQQGDDDLTENGIISDPGGPANVGADNPLNSSLSVADNPNASQFHGSSGCFVSSIF